MNVFRNLTEISSFKKPTTGAQTTLANSVLQDYYFLPVQAEHSAGARQVASVVDRRRWQRLHSNLRRTAAETEAEA